MFYNLLPLMDTPVLAVQFSTDNGYSLDLSEEMEDRVETRERETDRQTETEREKDRGNAVLSARLDGDDYDDKIRR